MVLNYFYFSVFIKNLIWLIQVKFHKINLHVLVLGRAEPATISSTQKNKEYEANSKGKLMNFEEAVGLTSKYLEILLSIFP